LYHAMTGILVDVYLYCQRKKLYLGIWTTWSIQISQMAKLDMPKYKTNTNQLR